MIITPYDYYVLPCRLTWKNNCVKLLAYVICAQFFSETILKNTREIEFSRNYLILSHASHPSILEKPFFLKVYSQKTKLCLKSIKSVQS